MIQLPSQNVNFPSLADPAPLCDKAVHGALLSTIVFVNYFLWYTAYLSVHSSRIRYKLIGIPATVANVGAAKN